VLQQGSPLVVTAATICNHASIVIGARCEERFSFTQQGDAVFSCVASYKEHTMKTKNYLALNDVREKIAELQDEAQAIVNLAIEEDRDLTDDEKNRVDSIFDTVGQAADGSDKATGLRADEDRMIRLEAEKQRIAAARAVRNVDVNGPTVGDEKPKVNAKPRARRNLKAFKGPDAEQRAYDSGQWIKANVFGSADAVQYCNDNGLFIRNAANEGTDSAGGYLTPSPLSNAIVDVREIYGVARKICRVIPMTSDALNIPKRSSGLTVYYPGEATAITESQKVWATIALAPVKRSTLTKISNELINDAVINVADDIALEVGRALGVQEDAELILGDGSGTYGSETGLGHSLGAGGTYEMSSGETAWTDVTLAHLHGAVGTLPEKFIPGASWLMSRAFFSQVVQKLMYAAGGNTVADVAGGSGMQLFGYPINFSDQMPSSGAGKVAAYFGDFAGSVVIGDREGVEVAFSGDYAFNEDVTTARGSARYDINVHGAGGSSAEGYVGLFQAAS